MTIFAHANHDHTSATIEQTPASLGANLPPDVWVGCAVIVGIGVLWALTAVIKCSLAVKVLLITAGLLVVGVVSYQYAPVVSTVALAVGMALSLLGVLAQLALPKQRPGAKE
jgi:hypothetical protein